MKIEIKLISTYHDVIMRPHSNPYAGEYDGEWWQILTHLSIMINGVIIDIPPGYVTDLGSVPKFARGIVNKAGVSVLAFIFHDWLYNINNDSRLDYLTRKDVDNIMGIISTMSKQTKCKTFIIVKAVRVGGWKFWKKRIAVVERVERDVVKRISYDFDYILSEIWPKPTHNLD